MKLYDIHYYFAKTQNSICPTIFDNMQYPWQVVKEKGSIFDIKKSEINGKIGINAAITGSVKIGKGTVVEPFAVIEGPVIIGKNCIVRPHAWIRPNCIIGDDCVIGHGVELKNALLFNKAKIGTNCFVGDSILGYAARVGSGTILGNRRFDQRIVEIKIGNEIFSTLTDKFGAILGDFVRLGAGVMASPGTIIGMHTWVYGGAQISGFIPADSLVKVRQTQEVVEKRRLDLKDVDLEGYR